MRKESFLFRYMKPNSLSLLLALMLGISFIICKKEEPEIIEPKITNDRVEVTATSACFSWNVEWVGKRISVVELSEHEDMSESMFYGSEEEINTQYFSITANDLMHATKYYYRFWVWNQNYDNNRFVFEKKSFSTLSELPVVRTLDVTNITMTSAICHGEVISDGGAEIIKRGICWSTNHNPTIEGNHESIGAEMGAYSIEIFDLLVNETYYVRAYAQNEIGIAYGEETYFTTGDAVLPTVITSNITDISWTTAECGGEVLDDGGASVTERGICWRTNHNPTISDNNAQSGSGIGEYFVNMSGLVAGTTYYVKAYAKNRIGIGYGEEKTFSTSNYELPVVTTSPITDITSTSANCGGNVTFAGGTTIIERGICWAIDDLPTTNDDHIAVGSGTGSFTSSISGLNGSTTYHVRAYAINCVGTAYGAEFSFTTLDPPPQGAINGLFSVSATKQVFFSQGNLQYQASTNVWRFAINQYDYVGYANQYISSTYSMWIDLFGWGTSGYNHGADCYQPWSTSQYDPGYYVYGSYTFDLNDQTGTADWGYNPIDNGGNIENSGWRTLTLNEWNYLFSERITPSGIRYAKALVNNVKGVILLPDKWSVNIYSLNSVNTSDANFEDNQISATQWIVLEDAGAVFLPAAGERYSGTSLSGIGTNGHYWLATHSDSEKAFLFSFGNYINPYSTSYRGRGQSVRLVKDY